MGTQDGQPPDQRQVGDRPRQAVIRRRLPLAQVSGADRRMVRVAADRTQQAPYFLALADGSPLSFTALWERWDKGGDSLEYLHHHHDGGLPKACTHPPSTGAIIRRCGNKQDGDLTLPL